MYDAICSWVTSGTQADDSHSLLHDLNLSAPAVFIVRVQLQAAQFDSDLLSRLLLRTQTGNSTKPKINLDPGFMFSSACRWMTQLTRCWYR